MMSVDLGAAGARARRKQANPQRKNVDEEESEEKDLISTMKIADSGDKHDLSRYNHETPDDNHNRLCNCDLNDSLTDENRSFHKHVQQGSQNLETVLRANGVYTKQHLNGVRNKDFGIQHILEASPPHGDASPSLNDYRTPATLLVQSISDLQEYSAKMMDDQDQQHQPHQQHQQQQREIVEEIGRGKSKVPLSPAAVKTLSEPEPSPPECPLLKCPHCGKSASGFQALQEHVESEHPRERPGSSPISPRSPTTAPILPIDNLHHCSPCNLTFPSKDQLEKHELLHSPNAQVSCKVCNKQFANVYRLQRHMISHDESAVLRKFKCPECEKAFKFKHHLKEHIRIHSGEKPFECGNCGKRFSHSGSYSSHMTSKKCLVMNLKITRGGRALGASPEKNHSSRSLGKRSSMKPSFNLGPDGGAFHFAPKYNGTNIFSAVSPRSTFAPPSSAPALHPFYMAAAPAMPPMHPYSIPALSQFLEQFGAPITPKRDDKQEVEEAQEGNGKPLIKEEIIDDNDDENMKEDDKEKEDRSTPNSAVGGDLEAVKRILETVNATVTKQLLQANVKQFSASPCGSSRSNSPTIEDRKDEVDCKHCGQVFQNRIDHHQHERYLCEQMRKSEMSEGLAAKLEEVAGEKSMNGVCSGSDEEGEKELDGDQVERHAGGVTVTTQDNGADGRKVRVRSLISDEHLVVLKHHYSVNPRPKREELSRIAEKIGFPVRVVQVWFQNTRARDRREGRLLQTSFIPITAPVPNLFQNNVPLGAVLDPTEQPLDLSTRRISPPPPISPGNDAINLSNKLCMSPQSYLNGRRFPLSNMEDSRRTPSPLAYLNLHQDEVAPSRLARMLGQPGLSIERFMFNNSDLRSPQAPIENGRASSSSPSSDKRSWRPSDLASETEDSGPLDSDRFDLDSKRTRLSLSNSYPTSDHEGEGQFVCDQCDKAFSKQSSLARHKYEHSGQRPHKCEVCEKAFKHKHHLTEHKRLHSGEKPFQCGKCLKRFSHSGSYSQHMNHRYSYCKPYRE